MPSGIVLPHHVRLETIDLRLRQLLHLRIKRTRRRILRQNRLILLRRVGTNVRQHHRLRVWIINRNPITGRVEPALHTPIRLPELLLLQLRMMPKAKLVEVLRDRRRIILREHQRRRPNTRDKTKRPEEVLLGIFHVALFVRLDAHSAVSRTRS
ncbi:hypothetical protein RHRU231_450232 [Rhodococcus ruber]|uniref:Uncharacterized protein n=1 Tax=Rhodococcus ruber TaxID=1830 RepID=A0A098BLE2_9NOCA|nr:hypothetical protein RHRU231_450232 [Rhodococcus ruber]